MSAELDDLIARVRELAEAGELGPPTREERIDWAYGNVRLSNPEITREMVEYAMDRIEAGDQWANIQKLLRSNGLPT